MKKYQLLTLLFLTLSFLSSHAQIPSPKEHFGFHIGDNYQLATFEQTEHYFKKLAESSDRIKYTVIGKTEEGREQMMLVFTSPSNHKHLERYKQIAQQLARAELSEQEALQLADEGKSVVWIDGGLHATETVGMHQLIELAYLLASNEDRETLEILSNSIILLTHANPDGQELVSNWYMREAQPEKRSIANLPRLYQKYAGHDNNRDFFMLNLKESQNIARQLFIEWNPQIMYNHHQTAPAGAVVAGAPYRDPFNYVFDPLLITEIEALGAAMSTRLNAENKPGYTQRGGSVFSTWYNGGLRTTTYFHNTVGLLTEIIGGPSPFDIPLVTSRLLPNSNTHNPVLPQTWYFRQSIDYSTSLNYAVMNYASKYRRELLFNIYRMGRNAIEKGQKDTWSLSPSKIAVIDSAYARSKRLDSSLAAGRYMPNGFMDSLYKDNSLRDPRGYIIPADQPDMATVCKFLTALSRNGIRIQQAATSFQVNGKAYPEKSYVVKTDQAFRPHVLDMFEPQDHPNDFEYPGGPPVPPYDAAGWTLAYLMHIQFDRILDDFEGPFTPLPFGSDVTFSYEQLPTTRFFRLPSSQNDVFQMVNTLLHAEKKVLRDDRNGDFYIQRSAWLDVVGPHASLQMFGASQCPKNAKEVRPLRIGLWDNYGGSMQSGWLRFLLESFQYKHARFYSPDLNDQDLRQRFDVLILPAHAIPTDVQTNKTTENDSVPASIPAPYDTQWGRTSVRKALPRIKQFLEQGGRIITLGSSDALAQHLDLGVESALVDSLQNPLSRSIFYTPGSVLTAKVNTQTAATWGYEEYADLYFNNNSVYRIIDKSITPLVWFDAPRVLKSGWSWGERYLQDGVIAFEKNLGKGKLTVFTPDITFRAQTHGTFRLLFNQLYR
ncbi:M14 family metallopeptidase [Sphingobacterium suaedae]|uniref:M14 family metallopeptidase n=1 Tax=Sphingobacterium suaedae TaxID=1686402 RepID=A0ABW5KHS2_9SPHI